LLPTEADCRDFVCSDVETTFSASPALQSVLVDESRVGQRGRPLKGLQMRNTVLSRRFEAGSLKVVPARAPRNLRRHSARYLVFDECSAMENSLEGDVVALAEKRTLSFANRKIVLGSTPLHEDDHVCRSYEASDKRIFELPCPDCGAFSDLWSAIEWPPGEPQRAAWRCPHCAALVPHRDKARMLQAGRWRATAPDVKGHASFRLSALVSPLANASWGKLAAEFLKAKDDPETLQPFINCTLAEPWRQEGDEIDESSLASRAEAFGLDRIPKEVLSITAGVDVQGDSLNCVLAGWSLRRR
jgi:phage terminase large subunit GpA-like protein